MTFKLNLTVKTLKSTPFYNSVFDCILPKNPRAYYKVAKSYTQCF